MKNFCMVISYDGSDFYGWQRQPNHKSVQGTIENKLRKIIHEEVLIHGAGRTDAGVHSLGGQTASFQISTNISDDSLRYALNRALPASIYIEDIVEMPMTFHARYMATGKTYEYVIHQSLRPNPLRHNYCHYIDRSLDWAKIREAMTYFVGTYDFSAFKASGSKIEDAVRTITSFELEKKDEDYIFSITGDGFLYNMIRIIIGLLIQIGLHKVKPESVIQIIKNGERKQARWTAPAEGLYLRRVYYPEIYEKLLQK